MFTQMNAKKVDKIKKAIKFVNDNYCMIEGCRCPDDDKDVVETILRALRKDLIVIQSK